MALSGRGPSEPSRPPKRVTRGSEGGDRPGVTREEHARRPGTVSLCLLAPRQRDTENRKATALRWDKARTRGKAQESQKEVICSKWGPWEGAAKGTSEQSGH